MPIIRIFRATAREGQADAFHAFFTTDAVEIVRRCDGLLAVTVGLPTDESPRRFMMTTIWRDLDALKGFTGDNWREAYIAPQEAPLIESASVEHYDLADT